MNSTNLHRGMSLAMNDCIFELGKKHDNLFLLTVDADISKKFVNTFPKRYYDIGIAEQNVINIATGLALTDQKVIINSPCSFLLQNAYMQIRGGLCDPNINVVMLGSSSGFSFSTMGASHQTYEDIGIMRILPYMKIFLPSDWYEAQLSLHKAVNIGGPCYIRLSEYLSSPRDKNSYGNFNKPELLRNGGQVLLVTMGATLSTALEIVDELSNVGVELSLLNLNSINVFSSDSLVNLLGKYKSIISIEEHYIECGIASYLSELLLVNNVRIPIFALGIKHELCTIAGTYSELLEYYGLDKKSIKKNIEGFLGL